MVPSFVGSCESRHPSHEARLPWDLSPLCAGSRAFLFAAYLGIPLNMHTGGSCCRGSMLRRRGLNMPFRRT